VDPPFGTKGNAYIVIINVLIATTLRKVNGTTSLGVFAR
jgi:hypothetical protein